MGTDKEKDASTQKLNLIASIGQSFWTVIVGAGVFFATIYSTQSVVNTRIAYIESEITSLKVNDNKISEDVAKLDSRQNTLLLDISNRLRDMEVRISELQVRVLYAIGEKEQPKKAESTSKP